MIKQFFTTAAIILAAVTVSPVFAGEEPKNTRTSIDIIKTGIKKIIIYGNVDVVLTPVGSPELTVDVNPAVSDQVKFIYQGNKLEIVSKQYSTKNKPVVRIPVEQLDLLEVNGDGKVYTESIIQTAKLNVFINGNCEVSIRSTGNIIVNASDEYELKYIRNDKIIIDASKIKNY